MTTIQPATFRLDPLHPELLVCEACGSAVCRPDRRKNSGRLQPLLTNPVCRPDRRQAAHPAGR
jgi:hypothetical protein